MSTLSAIFEDSAQNPDNPMHVFLYARRCYQQFEAGHYDCDDLYDLTFDYGVDDRRFLFFKNRQDDLAKKHRDRMKMISERILSVKIAEQHFLGKLASLINFADSKTPSNELKNARTIVQKLRYHNETIINNIAIEDLAYCTIHKQKSCIDDMIQDYKSTNTPPLFLHPNHPEDTIAILSETIGALTFSSQKYCDIRCFAQMDIMGYNALLASQNVIDKPDLKNISGELKCALTNILDDRHTWVHMSRSLANTLFDSLWDICEDHQMRAHHK